MILNSFRCKENNLKLEHKVLVHVELDTYYNTAFTVESSEFVKTLVRWIFFDHPNHKLIYHTINYKRFKTIEIYENLFSRINRFNSDTEKKQKKKHYVNNQMETVLLPRRRCLEAVLLCSLGTVFRFNQHVPLTLDGRQCGKNMNGQCRSVLQLGTEKNINYL